MLIINIVMFNLDITEVTWTRNGHVITDGDGGYSLTNANLTTVPGMAMLLLDSIISPALHGELYQVNISNPAGSDISTIIVTVYGAFSKNY